MTSNILKFIACISMLIDHMGLILFPEHEWMRWIGRLAMPLFGFFIAEGCRYTSNRKRYFLRLLLLGLACQTVYTFEQILSGGLRFVYLNILFTFSFSAIMCFSFINLEKSLESRDNNEILGRTLIFISSVVSIFAFDIFCTYSKNIIGVSISFDYGFYGAFLPLFAVVSKSRKKRLLCYTLGLILFALSLGGAMPYIWVALLDIPLLYFYNGKRGKYSTKYLFYIFYPLHLGLLYAIDLLI
ncbi:MAG: hypothetical protein IJA60_03380 [Clostridia bacterium]|nr:hypothetical protein [Clostridia bacterium]